VRDDRVAVNAGAVARASSWVAIGVATSKGLSLATAVALAHFLAPEDFGVVALAAVATDFVALLQDLGLSPALVQRRGDPRTAAATALRLHAGTAVALTLVTLLAADAIARGLGDPALATIVRVLALGTLVRGAGLVPRALLQRALAFRALAFTDVAALGLRGMVAVGLAWHGAGAWSIVAGDLTALAVQTALAWAACGPIPLAGASPEVRADLLRFGRPMTVASLVVWARDGLTRGSSGGSSARPTSATSSCGAPRERARRRITHVGNRVALPVYAAGRRSRRARARLHVTLTIVAALALPFAAVLFAWHRGGSPSASARAGPPSSRRSDCSGREHGERARGDDRRALQGARPSRAAAPDAVAASRAAGESRCRSGAARARRASRPRSRSCASAWRSSRWPWPSGCSRCRPAASSARSRRRSPPPRWRSSRSRPSRGSTRADRRGWRSRSGRAPAAPPPQHASCSFASVSGTLQRDRLPRRTTTFRLDAPPSGDTRNLAVMKPT
jgi:hypothetical protein